MKFKKLVVALLGVILIVTTCLPIAAFAAQPEKFTLRVGYWSGYGMDIGANGKLSGYTYDYMREIAQLNNWNVEFISCDWSEGLDLLQRGELDAFGPMQKTEERSALYDYTTRYLGEEYGALYARSDNNTVFYEDAQSLNGKRVGTMGGNFFLASLSDYCAQNQITVQTVAINNAKNLGEALADGSIDLQAAGSMQIPKDARMVLRFESEKFYYPTTKGNQYVLDGMDNALATIQGEDIFYNMRLYDKHYAQYNIEKKAFTAQEMEYIKNAPILRVGYEATGSPVEYYDKESDAAKGISIDLMEQISQYSGLQFEFIKTDSMEQALQMVQNGELELVSNLVGADNFTKLYQLEPTDALMSASLVFIIKLGTDFSKGDVVLALPEKWVGIRNHMEINYYDLTIKTYPDPEACLDAVRDGRAHLTVLNSLTAGELLSESRYRDLTVNNMTRGDMNVCLGAAIGGDALLQDVLNKSIAAIDPDAFRQIVYQHTISQPYEPSLAEIFTYNLPALFVATLIFMLSFFLLSIHTRSKLNKLAYSDPLTGEMNLNKFKLEAQKLMGNKDKTYGLMVIDVDKFKSINDLYGYEYGDNLIVLITKALRKTLLPGTILCHGVADKFYMIFEFLGELWLEERFNLIAKSIMVEIEHSLPECNIILNGGACVIKPGDNNIISIIDRANIASKQVKNYHESRFAFYEQSMYDKLNQIRIIENDMLLALKNEEFVVYLQPKIELSTSRIAGAEALVRWQHPESGLIYPGDFIPLFEKNGFIVNLDFYVLEQVCKLLERWKHEGRELFAISVNLSRRHLFHADTAQILRGIVDKYDVNSRLIEVELTENAFDNCDIPTISILFESLHKSGFTVSVDDFGAGYSSLSLLKDLPIDVLKIDKSFFDIHQNCKIDKMEILLESIISLSRKLNIKTVSEGVETELQVKLLGRLGCDLVQGFYFAKPMPIDKLEERLQSDMLFGSSQSTY